METEKPECTENKFVVFSLSLRTTHSTQQYTILYFDLHTNTKSIEIILYIYIYGIY